MTMHSLDADTDEAVLAIIEALRGYFAAHREDGLSRRELASRWYREDVNRALRFMEKTRNGHARMARAPRRASPNAGQDVKPKKR